MPFLIGPIAFKGTLDNVSAYPMRGVDGIVVRRKGGPSREKVKTSPSFENPRRTMSEFGGCSRAGSYVRMAMHPLRQLSDFNFGSDINSILHHQVQLRDETSPWGHRAIILSEHTRILEGFQTTQKAPSFDSIIRTPVYYTLNRANRSARVDIPELLRDINYFPQNNHAMFRLTITLGIVPDVRYDIPSKEYLPPTWYDQACYAKEVSTDWNPSLEGMRATTLDVAMNMLPPEDGWTLMLAIGIQYGALRENGKVVEIKRFGAAKILALRGKDGISGRPMGNDDTGDNEVHHVQDVVTEDADVVRNEPSPEVLQKPKIRYVYTMKETTTNKAVNVVYHYTISTAEGTSRLSDTLPLPTKSVPAQRKMQVNVNERQPLTTSRYDVLPPESEDSHWRGHKSPVPPVFTNATTGEDLPESMYITLKGRDISAQAVGLGISFHYVRGPERAQQPGHGYTSNGYVISGLG